MDAHTFDVGYRRLKGYYSQKDNQEKYDIWWKKRHGLSGPAYEKAVDLWIEGEKFFPTLGQLKAMMYRSMTPEEAGHIDGDDPVLSESEVALNKDLFPLFNKYLRGGTSKKEWRQQVRYFAEKHGLWDKMMKGQTNHAD